MAAPLKYFRECELSAKALELIEFDADSIRQVVAAERLSNPETWLVDPLEYEKNGRLLRDSESPRMLAYSKKDRVLYLTDGCNSCARHLPVMLEDYPLDELPTFAQEHELRPELVQRLASLLRIVH